MQLELETMHGKKICLALFTVFGQFVILLIRNFVTVVFATVYFSHVSAVKSRDELTFT